jgi:hypothetical protein
MGYGSFGVRPKSLLKGYWAEAIVALPFHKRFFSATAIYSIFNLGIIQRIECCPDSITTIKDADIVVSQSQCQSWGHCLFELSRINRFRTRHEEAFNWVHFGATKWHLFVWN